MSYTNLFKSRNANFFDPRKIVLILFLIFVLIIIFSFIQFILSFHLEIIIIFSILNFAKDCDYTLTMVDNLLDILTGGDHRKTKKVLEERRRYREEEDRIRQLMETKPSSQPTTPTTIADVKVEMAQLKTLSELGIETSFLEYFGMFVMLFYSL